MNYTLHQLHVFVKVAENESITKAADELCLTQPAVSIQLKNFQDQFEIPLTEVVGRKLYVTEFGKEVAQAAKSILEKVNEINHRTLAYKGQLFGKLKIAVVSTGKYVMPYFLSDFLKQHPGVELELDVTNKAKVLEVLERNEVDFALVSLIPDQFSLQSIPLMSNRLVLVSSGKQSWPKKNSFDEVISKQPFIFREKGSGTRQVVEQYLQQNGSTIPAKLELTSNEAVKQAVIAGLGCSIMPLIGIRNELKSGDLQIVPVKGLPIETTWNLIWLSGKKLSPLAKAYEAFLEEEKDALIQSTFGWMSSFD